MEDLSQHVRVVSSDDYARLTQMAVAAREWCEAYLGQQLCTATYTHTIDRFINLYLYQTSLWVQQVWPWYFQSQALVGNRLPNTWYTIWLPRNPVQSVGETGNVTVDASGVALGIKYIDLNGVTQTLDPSLYLVDTSSTQCRISPAFGKYWPVTQMRQDAVKITFIAGYKKVPSAIRLAICQLAAYWYDQREGVTFDTPTEIPMGIKSLLDSHATGRYLGGL